MNPSEDPADRLLDSLLREQARQRTADDELLAGIQAALDAPAAAKRAPAPAARWRSALPWAAAAALGLSAGAIWWNHEKSTRESPAMALAERAVTAKSERPPSAGAASQAAAPPAAPAGGEGKVARNDLAQSRLSAKPAAIAAESSFTLPEHDLGLPDGMPPGGDGLALQGGAGLGGGNGSGIGRGTGMGGGAGLGGNAGGGNLTEEPGPGAVAAADAFDKAREAPPAAAPAKAAAAMAARVKEKSPGLTGLIGDDGPDREQYGRLIDQPWKSPWQEALSTFSIDVDTASYTNVRRMILEGRPVTPDAVRIEECLNYFDYRYEGPKEDGPFAVQGTLATSPWKAGHLLARVAIKGREIEKQARPASNLVFLIDVSGSMQDAAKLPLLKRSMKLLLEQLDERDRVGMVVYAGSEGVALDSTVIDEAGRSKAIRALEKLEAGGSTNGGAGIARAYAMARQHRIPGSVNRVILATDGDFNVGVTGQGDLVSLVKEGATAGVSLSVLGFGSDNLNDAMLEAITNEGNGENYYIDNDSEARRVFLQKLTGTLVTIAKDVKIQVEFNPGKVKAYRLIGYANRILRAEDFANDKIDAGEIGAGHTVTAFYEIVPEGAPMPDTGGTDPLRYQRPAGREVVPSEDWFTLKLRYKHPEGDTSSLIETPVQGAPLAWDAAGHDFRFASAVALFGMKLRGMDEAKDISWQRVGEIAAPALAEDPHEQRAEFMSLLKKLGAK